MTYMWVLLKWKKFQVWKCITENQAHPQQTAGGIFSADQDSSKILILFSNFKEVFFHSPRKTKQDLEPECGYTEIGDFQRKI